MSFSVFEVAPQQSPSPRHSPKQLPYNLDADAFTKHFGAQALASPRFIDNLHRLSLIESDLDSVLPTLRKIRQERLLKHAKRPRVSATQPWAPSDVSMTADSITGASSSSSSQLAAKRERAVTPQSHQQQTGKRPRLLVNQPQQTSEPPTPNHPVSATSAL